MWSFFVRRIVSPLNSFVYRISGGRLLGRMSGLPLLLLTTTGRVSGKPRTAPLLYLENGDAYVLIASFAGQPQHPSWYLNLQADSRAKVQIGRALIQVRARTAEGDERARLWKEMADGYAGYDAYQRKTERTIPVVVLEPA